MGEKEQLHRLGELLIEEGAITQDELVKALEESGRAAGPLASALSSSSHVKREELAALLARTFSIPKFSLKDFPVDPEAVKLVPLENARKHEMVPLARLGSILCIGKANYYNRAAVIELRKLTGLKVKVLLCPEDEVAAAIERAYAGHAPQLTPVPAEPRPVQVPRAAPTPVPPPAAATPHPARPKPSAPTLVPSPVPARAPTAAAPPAASAAEMLATALCSRHPAVQVSVETFAALSGILEKRPDQVLESVADSSDPLSAIKIG